MTASQRSAGRKQAKQDRFRWRREFSELVQALRQAQRYVAPINDAGPPPRID